MNAPNIFYGANTVRHYEPAQTPGSGGCLYFPNISFVFMLTVADDGSLSGFNTIYTYAPHKDVSINEGLHI
jgi:hypothetical protein